MGTRSLQALPQGIEILVCQFVEVPFFQEMNAKGCRRVAQAHSTVLKESTNSREIRRKFVLRL
jgi:hypothetical protein